MSDARKDLVSQRANPSIYDEIGVARIINGRGATTAVGGTLMHPAVLEAMADAARSFVVLDDLNQRVGERIAKLTGMEAGYVTSGSAAAMAIAAAACIAGTDRAAIAQLPDTHGLPNEIIIHRAHRFQYDQMMRLSGARLVEIGSTRGTTPEELEASISSRSAGILYVDSRHMAPGALPFAEVVRIAQAHAIPTIVDAASTVPPIDHLRQWSRWGADLVIFSGGKGLRGPQDSGLLAGRADLIAAARANGNPFASIGRGMKVSKEAMAGLWKAIDIFLQTDHEAEHRAHLAQAETLARELNQLPGISCEIDADWGSWPAPVVRIQLSPDVPWTPETVQAELKHGTPPVHIDLFKGDLMVSTHCLLPGEEKEIIRRFLSIARVA